MSQDQFRLVFSGEALTDGLMDVRELAPALLAAGDLIQGTSRLINGDRTQVALRVKSDIQKGSFDIGLLVDQALIEQAKQFLSIHPHIKDAKEILELLFFYVTTASGAVMGLVKFVKWLRGRNIDAGTVTFINNATVQIQIGPDVGLTSQVVLDLAREESIRRALEGMVAPLKKEGIEDLMIDGGERRAESVSKDEASYFSAGYLVGNILLENEREAVFEIVRLSFDPRHKWGLTDGASQIRAMINDPVFWSDVRSGLRFAKGDHIRVRLKTRTFQTDSGELKSEYSVEEVLRHIIRTKFLQDRLEISRPEIPEPSIRNITFEDEA